MGGALRKTMIYLGLAEDDERYDAYDADDEFAEYDAGGRRGRRHDRASRSAERRGLERRAAVTPIAAGRWRACRPGAGPVGRAAPDLDDPPAHLQRGEDHRRGVPGGTPVIMNLGEMDDADAKRLVDFAAGLDLRAARGRSSG